MGRRPGRPQRGHEPLTREGILSAALGLVDAQGMAALSMRRLADALGVDPMAIYHHLPNKGALLAGMAELAFRELQVPPAASADWRGQLRAFARAYGAAIAAHPQLAIALAGDLRPGGAAVLRANELLYAALDSAGLPPPLVAAAADLLVDYLHGAALAGGLGRAAPAGPPGGLPALLASHPAEPLPILRRILAVPDGRAEPDAGVELIIAGVAAMLPQDDRA